MELAKIMAVTLFSVTSFFFVPASTQDIPLEKQTLTHAQETWVRALEWCESRGNPGAINPNDLDNTPSYGSWQFKPSTLEYFAQKYEVGTTTLMSRESQYSVLTQMILHKEEIRWERQFPACVKRLGGPP